ncbi:MAG: hypothetical protein M0P75_01310 [Candidatus Marinimicrobia bacterium]|nr:hypothetical protein [Candidatus Neomarinimicrobiota bacterium]
MIQKIPKRECKQIANLLAHDRLAEQIMNDLVKLFSDTKPESDLLFNIREFIADWEATIELDHVPGLINRIKKIKSRGVRIKPIPGGMDLMQFIDSKRKLNAKKEAQTA